VNSGAPKGGSLSSTTALSLPVWCHPDHGRSLRDRILEVLLVDDLVEQWTSLASSSATSSASGGAGLSG
jgi:hypothetical protein